MTVHSVTLHLPESLYRRFRQRAEWTHRSLETELLDAVASAAPVEEELSPEILTALEALETLGDEELWRLARQAMSSEASQELEALHLKQRDEGLSPEEDATRAKLILEYERAMLTRAQAARLLKDRGHDISPLLATPAPQ
jgi:plasmid stability protein